MSKALDQSRVGEFRRRRAAVGGGGDVRDEDVDPSGFRDGRFARTGLAKVTGVREDLRAFFPEYLDCRRSHEVFGLGHEDPLA